MTLVSPSLLSADFAKLGTEIDSIPNADWLHIDVMDGSFVPNISIGLPVVRSIRPLTQKPLDVHLMIVNPDQYIVPFRDAGADIITVHAEACTHLDRSIQAIKQSGAKAGVALNPHTSEHVLDYVLPMVDVVIVRTVNPGFGGQSLIDRVFPKIERIRTQIDQQGLSTLIEVDGGVKVSNAQRFVDAGAHVLVSGSGVFKSSDRINTIEQLQQITKR
jgi:ribulose-phosphate 3-epimerase